jgi:tetratricopeptide (TPR) repeat protein
MNSFGILFSILLLVGAIVPQTATLQTHQISGVVETIGGKRLPHVQIRITNIGGTTTTDSGEFIFDVAPRFFPGQSIEFSIGGDWVIESPWEGRTFVPLSGTDPIHVRVARRGDPGLLSTPEVVENIVVGVTSRLGLSLPKGENTFQIVAQPDDYLATIAKELGLTVEEIKSAINVWVSEVKGPYQKGLAALYSKHFGEASQFFKQSIAASETDLFAEYLALANAELSQGRYADAETAARKALTIHRDYPAALDILGWALTNENRFSEGESALKLALNIDEKNYGMGSPALAPHLENLGAFYAMSGRFAEGEAALASALAIIDQTHDRDDLTVAVYLSNMSEVLRCQGKYAEAASDAERAVSIATRLAGPASLEVTYPLVELGLIYKDTGFYTKAVEMLKRAETIDERELGQSHPNVGRDLTNLAVIYMDQRNYSDAEPLLKRSLSISQEAGYGDTLEAAGALCNLGYVYDEQGRYSDARDLLERALAIAKERLGPENYRVAIVHRFLGVVAFDEKNFNEAAKFFRKALGTDAKTLGPDNPSTAIDHSWLGTLYFSQGLYPAALSEFLLAYDAQLKNFGPIHPDLGRTASSIAATLRKEGKEAEAAHYDDLAAKARREPGDVSSPARRSDEH